MGVGVQFRVRNLQRSVQAEGQPEVRTGPSQVGAGRVELQAEVGQPTGAEVGRRQGTGGKAGRERRGHR